MSALVGNVEFPIVTNCFRRVTVVIDSAEPDRLTEFLQ